MRQRPWFLVRHVCLELRRLMPAGWPCQIGAGLLGLFTSSFFRLEHFQDRLSSRRLRRAMDFSRTMKYLFLATNRIFLRRNILASNHSMLHSSRRRVSPPDPRPEGRESRLFFDFLGRELTFFRNSLQGEGREWEKETPCGKGLGSWDT